MSNNKIVIVTYSFSDRFKVPKNIDLENKEIVKNWYVKWNILHIILVNGKELNIGSEGWMDELDLKYPSEDPEIESSDYYGIDDDEFADANLENTEENTEENTKENTEENTEENTKENTEENTELNLM
jgi:hypothetical protein